MHLHLKPFKQLSLAIRIRDLSCIAAIGCSQAVYSGPLDEFARNNGGTQAQVAVAEAVQVICPKVVSTFGGISGALNAPDSAGKDLTLRCNELINTAGDLDDSLANTPRSLGYTEDGQLLAALQQVSGEEITAQGSMTVQATNSQFSNISARMDALRLGAKGAGTTGVATGLNFEFNGVPLASDSHGWTGAPLGGGASADAEAGGLQRLGWFVNGSYNTGDRNASDQENGFDFDSFSVTGGIDYRFDWGVIGASLGYDDFASDFDESSLVAGGDTNADGISGSVFGIYEYGDFFIDAIATVGQLDYDAQRVMRYDSFNTNPNCQCSSQNRNLDSSTDADHYTISIDAGWQKYVNEWSIQPSVGVSYRSLEINGYTERDTSPNGGMGLRFGDQDIDSVRSIVGLQVSRAINQSFGVLRPTLSVDWYHEFEDEQTDIDAKYAEEDFFAVTNPGLGFSQSLTDCLSCFTILSDRPDEDYGVIGAGVAFVFPNFLQLMVYYEGLVGYEDLSSNAFTISLRGQF